MTIKNLWEKDRKIIHKELVREYLSEGYSIKEARKLATQETDDIKSGDYDFVKICLMNIQMETTTVTATKTSNTNNEWKLVKRTQKNTNSKITETIYSVGTLEEISADLDYITSLFDAVNCTAERFNQADNVRTYINKTDNNVKYTYTMEKA